MTADLPRLSAATLSDAHSGATVPGYPREQCSARWIHIGVGAFHRSHQQVLASRLLEAGKSEWAIRGCSLREQDNSLCADLAAQDCLYALVERGGNRRSAQIIGSLCSISAAGAAPSPAELMADPAAALVSLTVTEGGYCVHPATGELDFEHPSVAADLAQPQAAAGLYGTLAAGLRARKAAGGGAIAIASCDNIAGNGNMLSNALLAFLERADPQLHKWAASAVSFPNSMVDRITPAASEADAAEAAELIGLRDARPVVCEPFWQWVIEDKFAGAQPPLGEAGALVVADAKPYEKLKLWMLNGSHQALAQAASLLDTGEFVHEAMAAAQVRAFVAGYLDEVAPHLDAVPGVDVADYRKSVLDRYANAGVRDTVARIAAFGSDRLPRFVIPPLLAARAARAPCAHMAMTVAAWCARIAHDGGDDTRPGMQPVAALRTLAEGLEARPADFMAGSGLFPQDAALDAGLAEVLAAAAHSIRTCGCGAALAALALPDQIGTPANSDRDRDPD